MNKHQRTLTLNAVSKVYGDKTVVDTVSLEIMPGEFFSLLGPSGCGKTTILQLIAGFERVSAGEILLGETVLANAQQHVPTEQRNIGMVFQSYALWPHMRVFDNVAYPLKVRKINRREIQQRVKQALADVELSAFSERYPKALSGGQRQRVALARCLVTQPDVIMLDEPLANLDKHLRATMEARFTHLNQTFGTTFIYVTHDQTEAMALSDRIAVLKDGKLQQCDTPENLYAKPNSPWIGQFIGQGSLLSIADIDKTGALDSDDIYAALKKESERTTTALIRPQHVRIIDEHSHSVTTIPATVATCIFRGDHYVLNLTIESGETLDCKHHRKIAIDSNVNIALSHAWVF